MMNYKVVFESERICFVNIHKELADEYVRMVNDPEVSRYITLRDRFFTYDDEVKWIEDKLKDQHVIFSMIEKETGRFIGNIELLEINNNVGELGICITPAMQNKHYGSEAIPRFMKYCSEELGLENIELSVFSHNERAIALYQKLGFTEYKRDVNVGTYHGIRIDDICMKLK